MKFRTQSKEFRQSKIGMWYTVYYSLKASSRKRGHKEPSFSLNDFTEWILKQENLDFLYKKWEESGFKSSERPSVDRKDDSIGYIFENMQLMTWRENRTKNLIGRKVLSKPDSYYETKGVMRSSFKITCKKNGNKFEDYEEIFSNKKTKHNHKLFYYKKKGE